MLPFDHLLYSPHTAPLTLAHCLGLAPVLSTAPGWGRRFRLAAGVAEGLVGMSPGPSSDSEIRSTASSAASLISTSSAPSKSENSLRPLCRAWITIAISQLRFNNFSRVSSQGQILVLWVKLPFSFLHQTSLGAGRDSPLGVVSVQRASRESAYLRTLKLLMRLLVHVFYCRALCQRSHNKTSQERSSNDQRIDSNAKNKLGARSAQPSQHEYTVMPYTAKGRTRAVGWAACWI